MARPQLASALTSTAALMQKGRCNLKLVQIYNPSNAVAFVQLFDASATASVTVGTTAPMAAFGVGTLKDTPCPIPQGVNFTQGIVAAATTTATGNGNPSAALIVNLVID